MFSRQLLRGESLDTGKAGVVLPCNVVVREIEDGVAVEAMDPGVMATLVGREDIRPVADEAVGASATPCGGCRRGRRESQAYLRSLLTAVWPTCHRRRRAGRRRWWSPFRPGRYRR